MVSSLYIKQVCVDPPRITALRWPQQCSAGFRDAAVDRYTGWPKKKLALLPYTRTYIIETVQYEMK